MSEEKGIDIVQDVNALNVLGADPAPFQPTDVVWSRSETEAKDRRGTFIPASAVVPTAVRVWICAVQARSSGRTCCMHACSGGVRSTSVTDALQNSLVAAGAVGRRLYCAACTCA